MTTEKEVFVGIDVSKTSHQLAVLGQPKVRDYSNQERGHQAMVRYLKLCAPTLIVLEATGGLERELAVHLRQAGFPVAVVNPTRVREFARALGRYAKSDPIDARTLAHFGQAVRPEVRRLPSEQETQLLNLVRRRRQIVGYITTEKNRLHTTPTDMEERVVAHLKWLQEELDSLNKAIDQLIQSIPEFCEKAKLLRSVPGIGPVNASTLLAEMPELGNVSRQKIAALAGVAPFNRDSGQKKGKRKTFGGRYGVRSTFYMAVLSAKTHNPIIKRFYDRLIKKGKLPKVALVACMRKLLSILTVMLRRKESWRPAHL